MSQLITKIHCPNPNHQDDTESCAVYDDGHGYCFGCGTYFKDVGNDGPRIIDTNWIKSKSENIQEKIKYIKSLPTQQIRGLELPYDNRGYYVVWPDESYYKLRLWDNPNSKSRYVSPIGHTYRPFILLGCEYASADTPLVVVEGEINALSLRKAIHTPNIVSFGSASELGKPDSLMKEVFRDYRSIVVFVDNDPPGVAGALKFKEQLKEYCPDIRLYTLDRDFNDLLVSGGVDSVKEKVKNLGLRL